MTPEKEEHADPEGPLPDRVMAAVRGEAGPTFLALAGVHGNEPAGVHALERVSEALERKGGLRGTFVAAIGNLAAVETGRRFLARDLNRIWFPERIDRIRMEERRTGHYGEEHEQIELLDLLDTLFPEDRGFFLDLHTTSGGSSPFLVVSEEPGSIAFGSRFPVPTVVGLTRHLDGTLLEYICERGISGAAVEGGQHTDPGSTDALESCIWVGLHEAGMLEEELATRAVIHRRRLSSAVDSLPGRMEIRYRHAIVGTDRFTMKPGFVNFTRIEAGETIACDVRGEIRAPVAGRVLMPLYQDLGEDGFFIARES